MRRMHNSFSWNTGGMRLDSLTVPNLLDEPVVRLLLRVLLDLPRIGIRFPQLRVNITYPRDLAPHHRGHVMSTKPIVRTGPPQLGQATPIAPLPELLDCLKQPLVHWTSVRAP